MPGDERRQRDQGFDAPSIDGLWRVDRTGGLLPPLVGVTKRIRDGHGETRLGGMAGARFEVVGDELRYLGPFRSFVDRLRPHGDGFSGTATFRGRAFGWFELRRLGEE
jgi:hypothetical protein